MVCQKTIENITKNIVDAFQRGVRSVQPHVLLNNCIKVSNKSLLINGDIIPVRNAYVIGFGKAAGCMVSPVMEKLKLVECKVKKGIISVPVGFHESMKNKDWFVLPGLPVTLYEGALNNLPDIAASQTADKILNLISNLSKDDTLFVLISGGGSALLPLTIEQVSLKEKFDIVKHLSKAGASIYEINCVRRALSSVKGGKLVQKTKANVITLIISDTNNDDLSTIASGPTIRNSDEPGDFISVLEKYNVSVKDSLKNIEKKTLANFNHVKNYIVGNNLVALKTIKSHRDLNDSIIVTNKLEGNAADVGVKIAKLGFLLLDSLYNRKLGNDIASLLSDLQYIPENIPEIEKIITEHNSISLIFGGETTVVVKGNGKGGRNQELILSSSLYIDRYSPSSPKGTIAILSGGTDGIDGPTDAAGAVTFYIKDHESECWTQVKEARLQSLNPEEFLKNNNSYEYFSSLNDGQYHLKIGHTGTNVMDIIILRVSLP